jgi:hypothetical protein
MPDTPQTSSDFLLRRVRREHLQHMCAGPFGPPDQTAKVGVERAVLALEETRMAAQADRQIPPRKQTLIPR